MNQSLTNPKVSVIVPVYGVERYIERCSVGIFNQTYDNLEIIFVDDQTKDCSIAVVLSVLKRFPNRKDQVSIIHHEKNLGLSSARETGINACSGDYIVHIDSDDFVETDFIESCVKKCAETGADIAVVGVWHEYPDKRIEDFSACRDCSPEEYAGLVISQSLPSNIWGKLYRSALYKENNIHCLPNVSYGEDYAVLPKLVSVSKKIAIVQKPLYHYVHYNMNSFTNAFKWKNLEDLIVVDRNVRAFFEKSGKYTREFHISKLKWTAWTLRRVYESDSDAMLARHILGTSCYSIADWKYLSLNHNVILLLNQLRLFWAVKCYVKMTKFLVGRFIRKK